LKCKRAHTTAKEPKEGEKLTTSGQKREGIVRVGGTDCGKCVRLETRRPMTTGRAPKKPYIPKKEITKKKAGRLKKANSPKFLSKGPQIANIFKLTGQQEEPVSQ